MNSITLQNYRCFGSEEQTARLAPLTLLVGPNSTGKTSFLALIRALWDVAFREVVPNFREEPFDLGSFEDIVYRATRASANDARFSARFESRPPLSDPTESVSFLVEFANGGIAPFPTVRTYSNSTVDIRMPTALDFDGEVAKYRVDHGEWTVIGRSPLVGFGVDLPPIDALNRSLMETVDSDRELVRRLIQNVTRHKTFAPRPFAGSPIRSRPRRTYDPTASANDAQGDYVPSFLADAFRSDRYHWDHLKTRLEDFGRASQLFDDISVRSFGRSNGDPFQIQVRKHGLVKSKTRKGPWRNLVDVGYGVSQALPLLTELVRIDGSWRLLLQQPEVHLHPQAQAALGTLFCQVAAGGRQLVVETHSDYIIDRVRMDVRDGQTNLKAGDVSILYFEPRDLDVKIHSIRLDEMGNVLDAPPGYRKFFMEEIRRSIGL